MDAGIFYCPYVPLQMVRAVDSSSFQPRIAFKTRYGMVANPFAEGAAADANASGVGSGRMTGITSNAAAEQNGYYRKCRISNLM